ncbi:malonyl-CoA decarboxylase [Rhodospirillum sp. A1_3_36]|uniref:malonyl-CoA decarboxylase n=1 Tax=Rhodospirillum sp. A1_3_36 TaxID=3391666 RepID=UPI0039A711F4
MTSNAVPASPGLMARLSSLWRDIPWSRNGPFLENLSPDLPDGEMDGVRSQLHDCLEGKGGEVSARSRAAALGRAYLALSPVGRLRFLTLLATEFAPNRGRIEAAARALADLPADADPEVVDRAEARLRRTLVAPRRTLLTQFNALPEGVKFLVDMRGELLRQMSGDPALKGLERDLRDLLAAWFDVGFLELKQVTWQSPAAFLEKIITYEAVHAIQSWEDLKNRLDRDRRLYAFVHPRMPDEPLIFVEVALVHGISERVGDLLDLKAPVLDPSTADTAIFYSISNAQAGLAGISFGNFLIKRVVETLRRELPGLKAFSTLSPVPGFRRWLEERLAQGDKALLLPAERKGLKATGEAGPKGTLKRLVEEGAWIDDAEAEEALKAPLTRLCARYLIQERRPADPDRGRIARALDPVAHFHLTNGARVERINWRGDLSSNGLRQSVGMMVNYLYKLDDIERNHEAYQDKATIAASPAVRALAKG